MTPILPRYVRGKSVFRILTVLSLAAPLPMGATPPQANAPTFEKLDGKWRTSEGEVIYISDYAVRPVVLSKHSNQGPLVEGGYLSATTMSGGECPKLQRNYLKVEVHSGKLIGDMVRCSHPTLVETCGDPGTWTAKVRLTVQSSDFISGYYRSEWYKWVSKPVKKDCHYERDSTQDKDKPFNLTRCRGSNCDGPAASDEGGISCPEMGKVTAVKAGVDDFIKVNTYLESRAQTSSIGSPEMLDAFGKLGTDMGAVSNALGVVTGAAEQCENAGELFGLLSAFDEAIQKVNKAGCDGKALAAGFDALARATGDLGLKIGGDFPGGLGAAFKILSEDRNFFTKVGGALSRPTGAGQFPFVDGYTPSTCTN